MKRRKDEEKMMGPMFPRLHVNDTSKGGPKAPPRNKMALYEQLSVPSQRYSHAGLPRNLSSSPAMTSSNQSMASERGVCLQYQFPRKHQQDQQFGQYSDISPLLTQAEQRKKLVEDDFRVPIFVHPVSNQECVTQGPDPHMEKIASNLASINGAWKFKKFQKIGILESSKMQAGKKEYSKTSATGTLKAISIPSSVAKNEGIGRQTNSTAYHEPGDNLSHNNSIDGIEPSLCFEAQSAGEIYGGAVSGENNIPSDKVNSSNLVTADPAENQNNFHDISDTDSHDNRSCRLERGDSSVTETSGVESVCIMDVTPDDVVGVIGQKRFWKARRAIANQQRVFAIQVFELHRLIKVQRLVAASPHILLEDSTYLGTKSAKALPGKRIPVNLPHKEILHVSKQKGELEKSSHKKESASENDVVKVQNGVSPPNVIPSIDDSPAPSMSSAPWCFNQPHGQQWLIPVMSPTEGLIYKPYAGPGFVGPAGGVPDVAMGNFYPPACGVPPIQPYQLPPPHPQSFPHGYFPPYTMPIMNASSFSSSSVKQMNTHLDPCYTATGNQGMSIMPGHKSRTSPDALNKSNVPYEDMEVQASTASSPVDQIQDNQACSVSMERRNMLPLFPVSRAPDASKLNQQPSKPQLAKVIKVVPHNARSATESAARIFRSIQEERKQYDSL